MAALAEPRRQLARGGGLARALQAGHQDHRGRPGSEVEAGRVLAQQGDQLVADDLDHLLGGRKGRHHLLAHSLLPDVVDKLLDHVQVDVGFEQGDADLPQSVPDIFFGDGALTAEILEGPLQLVG